MWILEAEGDVLNHKRIWLRPGKTYLFGRTKPETGPYRTGFQINHKTVSRKHLILTVASVAPDEVGLLGHRSQIAFEDAGTKLGTVIDGQKIKDQAKLLSTTGTHTFKPGGYDYTFKVTWKPVVLSYTFSSKEYKNGKDPMMPVRARLTELDVKAIPNYAAGKTTHVIASKRNTARNLQALVEGGRIITEDFVSALEAAATATDLAESESFAPLEQDFDRGWPDETTYLPAPGKEPGPKEAEHYAPAPERKDIFHGFAFVFFDTRQYESLQPPITVGGGKAVVCPLEESVTLARDVHRFVKDTAGESDNGELSGDNQVVCVKYGSHKASEEWTDRFMADLCLAIGFRMIEQNAFLDAILTKDPARLFKRLQYSDDGQSPAAIGQSTSRQPASAQAQGSLQPESATTKTSKPASRRPMRGKVHRAFKGFDDGFDDSEIRPAPFKRANGTQTQTQTTNGHVKDEVAIDEAVTGTSATQPHGRKRPIPDSDGDSELEEIEKNMFQGMAAMKKRRLESKAFEREYESSSTTTRATSELVATDEMPAKKKKAKTAFDVNAALRAHKEAEAAKQPRGSDDENDPGIDDMTIDQMKTLAVIEEFEPRKTADKETYSNGEGPRWKDEWNGRKNFKKFRRQGAAENNNRRGHTVILPLEEVKTKDTGIGEAYWTTEQARSRGGRARGRRDSSDEEDLTLSRRSATRRSQPSNQSRDMDVDNGHEGDEGEDRPLEVPGGDDEADEGDAASRVPSNLQTGEEPEVIDVEAPRTTRARGPASEATATQQSSMLAGRKRDRVVTQSSAGAPKRQKRLDEGANRSRIDEGSDSDDELKFRFKRRK